MTFSTAKMQHSDNIFKIILLLFFTACFDFVEFIVATFYIPKFSVVSSTAEYRFGGFIITIFNRIINIQSLKIIKFDAIFSTFQISI